jgi:hypothetical protein
MWIGRLLTSERLSGERTAMGKCGGDSDARAALHAERVVLVRGLQLVARDRTPSIRPGYALTKNAWANHAFVSRYRQ